jgi:major membrane immunogen (membrane-anchored lipoprotein)
MASSKFEISAIIKVMDEATGPLKKIGATFKGVGETLNRTGEKFNSWGSELTTKVTLPLIGIGVLAVRAFDKSEKAIAGVRQGILSTGKAAGKTVEELTTMASELQKKTLFGDDEILAGATVQLLTFTNIANKEFDRTQKAVLDVATKLSMTSGGTKDLTGTAIMLGKALNDPVSNLGALSRSGIQFSEGQKVLIKRLWETGQQAEAQRVILAEIEKQYGGTAEAAAKAGLGPMQMFMNQVDDLLEVVGGRLVPIISKVTEKLKTALDWFNSLDEGTKDFIITAIMVVAALGPVLKILSAAINFISGVRSAVMLLNAALVSSPLGWILLGIGALSFALYQLIFNFEAVRQAAIKAWDAVAGFMNAKFGEGTMTRVASMENRVAMPDIGMSVAGAKKSESKTEVDINLKADPGTEAKIDGIKKTGNSTLKLNTYNGKTVTSMATAVRG